MSKNLVSLNTVGINVRGASGATGNIVSGNGIGVFVSGAARVVGNAASGNSDTGINVLGPFTGTATGNNIFGNGGGGNCGLDNEAAAGLVATNNYWGASTGPGPNPADAVCNADGGTTTASPFATRPFIVRVPIRP